MKRGKKIWITIIIVICFFLFILPAVAFAIVRWGILPPEKLTPLVVREANKYLNGELECEKIELTFFETYPRLGVRITNGTLVSFSSRDSLELAENLPLITDSLLTFKRAVVSVNPLDYLALKKITIGGIFIDTPSIYVYVNEEGKPNWDVYLSEPDTVLTTDTVTPLPPIDLQRIRIKDGHLVYNDRQSDLYTEIEGFFLRIDGALTQGGNSFDVETGSSSILFDSPSYTLKNKLALQLKSKVELTNDFNTIKLERAEMLVNDLPFTADGQVTNEPDSSRIRIDMDMGLTVSDLNELLKFAPEIYFQDLKKMDAKGSILLTGNVHGFLGDSIVPTINLCCQVENGSYYMKGVKQGIDLLELDVDLHLNGQYPDSSFVSLEKLKVEGLNTSFTLKAQVTDLFRSPAIDGYMKGKIDFSRLAEEFLNPDTLFLRGKMDADISATFLLDDLLAGHYNNVVALGDLQIDRMIVRSPLMDTNIRIMGAKFSVDSTRQTSSFLDNEELRNAYLAVDTLHIRYKNEINTQIAGLDVQAKTSPVIDTTTVMPLTTHIKVAHMRTRLPDSVWVVAKNTYLRGGIKGSESNKMIPTIGASITVDTLRYFDIPLRSGTILANSMFNLQALPYRDAMRQRMAKARSNSSNQPDSLSQQMSRRNRPERPGGTNRPSRERQEAQPVDTTSSFGFLRNWEVMGSVSFDEMRLFSRMFPLPMRMDKSKLSFDTDKMTLKDARFHAGKSDFLLNGEVKSMRRAMLRGGKLTGDLSINSDYIDCNELLHAMSRGWMYMERYWSDEDVTEEMQEGNFMEMGENQLMESVAVETSDSTDVLFVVPDFMDMTLRTNIKKLDYDDVKLENVLGEIVMRNQSINLKQLDINSNIGNGNVTMVYTAKTPEKASVGFDLEMDDIMVERLIGMFPSIDSLLPMLRSFEGVLDCQMTATCELDSTMSVIMPTLNSSCYLSGQNMVLLDGETFTEISKTLMFKNKQRNLIDSVSVDLAIRDNKIDVFPFVLEMDRYKVAIGGTHNLDMTFDYHLSVLKSPVPFKLGIDIKGDLDKFKFKITKCRYKDILKPARQAELDSTRTNIRTEIRELLLAQMRANAPELTRDFQYNQIRRRPQLINDVEETEDDNEEVEEVEWTIGGGDSDQ